MAEYTVKIRPAEPTFDEGLVYAKYLDEAFEGFFRRLLGRQVANIVAEAFVQPNHAFSHRHALFAETNETIVGMAAGYTFERRRDFSDQPLKQAAGIHVLSKVGAALLCFRLRFLGKLAEGDFYLQAIAVDATLRGEGIGSALLDSIEDRAGKCGATRFFLDASAGNNDAIRFYKRHGMAIQSTWPSFPLMPSFVVQMTKPL